MDEHPSSGWQAGLSLQFSTSQDRPSRCHAYIIQLVSHARNRHVQAVGRHVLGMVLHEMQRPAEDDSGFS